MSDAYSQAGVNIAAGNRATALMKDAIKSTYGAEVLSETGSFGGLFSAQALTAMDAPVLVASTDGVGTKTMVAAKMGKWDTIGQDLVNHCVNDILVQGAKPLFFLDYIASSSLVPEQIAAVVGGCATACKAIGVALLGGETAEMPGVYQSGELDLVGTIIGVVDKANLIDGSRIQSGDVILSLPSTGLHTNGFSLARKVLADFDWTQARDDLGGASIGEALLAIHRCYLPEVNALRTAQIDIHGLAHITGGGVLDNLPRILPEGLGAIIRRNTWSMPPIFKLIQEQGDISDLDMFHAFNMGLGMLVIVPAAHSARIIESTTIENGTIVGEIVAGHDGVDLQ
ncbi:MAG: phosphoribosylformylglycinamidine cyclo-ligase [Aggregatilineales bacterium]